eukprot:gnl/TRDRNA2_/TRDRNA2_158591_c0_seq1.p1 gnl/TRDRNA2_/TRDRNA2_158591_c0~~gnl/TRDRNA2_/TRDRNA2_158591_c0_seq1.p1  ORF type:complete len:914 (+),score=138.86 gnl/TRDRNA2_/TRDRNA2_158591_c0_seq1:97-2838(+)
MRGANGYERVPLLGTNGVLTNHSNGVVTTGLLQQLTASSLRLGGHGPLPGLPRTQPRECKPASRCPVGDTAGAAVASAPAVNEKRPAIVQFAAPIYFVEEHEGHVNIDIMRLGSMVGAVTVSYWTEDGSAQAGEKYESSCGEITFEEGEWNKTIQIGIVDDEYWATTLEFKMHLGEPEGCMLGTYLHTCRIKIIDDDLFPSSKYKKELVMGEQGVRRINGSGLFFEYFKLNMRSPGISWRMALSLFMDQWKNIYFFFTLAVSIYLVDVVFNIHEPWTEDKLIVTGRQNTAVIIGIMYILPLVGLHLWDVVKIRLDLVGRTKLILMSSFFRKYLNYSENSRQQVMPSDLQIGMMQGIEEMADGFMAVVDCMQITGKALTCIVFILYQNPESWKAFVLMPTVMAVFAMVRAKMNVLAKASGKVAGAKADVIELTNEACLRYRLIADYAQRPHMNDLFFRRADSFRKSKVPESLVVMNNSYFTQWLSSSCIGIFIAMHAELVLSKDMALGTFLAVITAFTTLGLDFRDLYVNMMRMQTAIESLRSMTLLINMETDLLEWKKISRYRRAFTHQYREELHAKALAKQGRSVSKNGQDELFKSDFIPIQLKDLRFGYPPNDPIFMTVNLEVQQGRMIAIVGPHKAGRSTLMRLLGHTVFPLEGTIYVPSHLRILHVEREPMMLNLSPFRNLIYGLHHGNIQSDEELLRVKAILELLRMSKTLELVEDMWKRLTGSSPTAATSRSQAADRGAAGKSSDRPSKSSDDWDDDESLEDEDEYEDNEEAVEVDEGEILHDHDEEWKTTIGHHMWHERLTYTEKTKIHLARALIMNPEVMVAQRPLLHYSPETSEHILNVLRVHVKNRGVCLPEEQCRNRRPRTCFFTPETIDQAKEAEHIWQVDPDKHTVYEVAAESLMAHSWI